MDEEKLLSILKDQGMMTDEQENACLLYQQEYLKNTGESIPVHRVLIKLEIVTEDELNSICKAFEQVQEEASGQSIEEETYEEKQPSLLGFAQHTPKKITPAFLKKPQAWDEPQEKVTANEEEEEEEEQEEQSQDDSKQPSLFVAYLLLFFTGIFGGHRFYLRNYRSAILYSMTLGFAGIGVIIDIIMLPFIYKSSCKKDIENELIINIRDSKSKPNWFKELSGFSKLLFHFDSLVQYVYVLISPILLSIVAIYFWKPWLLFLAWLWVTIFIFNAPFTRFLQVRMGFQHIPFIELLNNSINRLVDCCFMKRPSYLIGYLFYPIWAPLACIISVRRRKEYLAFFWLFMIAVVGSAMYLFNIAMLNKFDWIKIHELIKTQVLINVIYVFIFMIVIVPSFVSLATMRACGQTKRAMTFSITSWILYSLILVMMMIPCCFIKYHTINSWRDFSIKLQNEHYSNIVHSTIEKVHKLAPEQVDEKEQTRLFRRMMFGVVSCDTLRLIHATYKDNQWNYNLGTYVIAKQENDHLEFTTNSYQEYYEDSESMQYLESKPILYYISTFYHKLIFSWLDSYRIYFDKIQPE